MTKRVILATADGLKSVSLDTMLRQTQGWQSLTGDAAPESMAAYYAGVAWLYRAVNQIAAAVATLPVRFTRDGEPLEGAADLPWMQSFSDLVDALAGDLTLYGAGYVFLGPNRRGQPTQMRRLLPTTITPVIDAERGVTGFTRNLNGQRINLSLEDVVYVWLPNRTGETGPGTAPARAALAAAGVLANIDSSAEGLFANGAIRPTIAYIEDTMPDAEVQRVESAIKRRLMGVKHAFGITAVSKKVEFSTVGEYPDRLAMPELTDSKRQDVATALGIPQSMLAANAANFATSHQDALNFYDLTVIPMAQRILSAFNTQLLDRYGIVAETAEDELELYQAMQGEQVTALAALFDRRVITVNEFRDRVGLEPLADGMEIDPDNDADASPEDEPADHADDMPEPDAFEPQRAELRAWQRFAVKRLKEGRALRPFETQHVPPVLAAAIAGQLEGTDADAAKAVFDGALAWVGYP